MITKKNVEELSQQISSIYRKGLEAADKNNTEYAINKGRRASHEIHLEIGERVYEKCP